MCVHIYVNNSNAEIFFKLVNLDKVFNLLFCSSEIFQEKMLKYKSFKKQ